MRSPAAGPAFCMDARVPCWGHVLTGRRESGLPRAVAAEDRGENSRGDDLAAERQDAEHRRTVRLDTRVGIRSYRGAQTPVLIALLLIAVWGCRHPPAHTSLRAPNPNGCYVVLYAEPKFAGQADLVNGPFRWGTLDHRSETNTANWHNRIRSLRLGSTATLKAYTKPDFTGDMRQFAPGTAHPSLDALSGHVQSLDLVCPSGGSGR